MGFSLEGIFIREYVIQIIFQIGSISSVYFLDNIDKYIPCKLTVTVYELHVPKLQQDSAKSKECHVFCHDTTVKLKHTLSNTCIELQHIKVFADVQLSVFSSGS